MTAPEIRPRDLAVLLLAAGGHPPRARARDGQADIAGGDLRRRMLDRLAALDPEASELDTALASIVSEIGEPTGPTRGVAMSIRQEWDSALLGPCYFSWLVAEAVEAGTEKPRRRGDGLV